MFSLIIWCNILPLLFFCILAYQCFFEASLRIYNKVHCYNDPFVLLCYTLITNTTKMTTNMIYIRKCLRECCFSFPQSQLD